jgi:hypothetical protein
LFAADDLPDVVSMEEAATNAARVAELEDMLQTLQHKYKARKKQVHTIKKQKLGPCHVALHSSRVRTPCVDDRSP